MFYHQQSLRQITQRKKTGELLTTAVLRHNPSNQYDSNAVEVLIDGNLIGYIPKEDTARYIVAYKSYSSRGESLSCDVRMTWKTSADGIDADVRLSVEDISFKS